MSPTMAASASSGSRPPSFGLRAEPGFHPADHVRVMNAGRRRSLEFAFRNEEELAADLPRGPILEKFVRGDQRGPGLLLPKDIDRGSVGRVGFEKIGKGPERAVGVEERFGGPFLFLELAQSLKVVERLRPSFS